jgi:hypothetical protein
MSATSTKDRLLMPDNNFAKTGYICPLKATKVRQVSHHGDLHTPGSLTQTSLPMVFLQALPPAPLTPYIHQYWYMSTDEPEEFGHLRQMMFPIDFGGLSFYFGSSLPVIEH